MRSNDFYVLVALYGIALLLNLFTVVNVALVVIVVGVFAMVMWFASVRIAESRIAHFEKELDADDVLLLKLLDGSAIFFTLVASLACAVSLIITVASIVLDKT